jgi:hypothetical protein
MLLQQERNRKMAIGNDRFAFRKESALVFRPGFESLHSNGKVWHLNKISGFHFFLAGSFHRFYTTPNDTKIAKTRIWERSTNEKGPM